MTPAQNAAPMTTSSTQRHAAPRCDSVARDRLRTVRSFGDSTCASVGAGSGASATASGIQHLDQLARRALARELQKIVLEPVLAQRSGARHQLVHGARRTDASTLDDRDAVAHVLGDLERVRRHEDGMSATRILAEQVLEDA